jgi:hypothetical protein
MRVSISETCKGIRPTAFPRAGACDGGAYAPPQASASGLGAVPDQKKSAPTAAAVLHRRWRRSFRLGGPLTGAAICAARAPFRDQYPEERDLQNDLMPQYTCHHMAKQTWRGLGVLLTPMSREDHSTQCDMASRANKRMVLKARDTRHVLRGHLRLKSAQRHTLYNTLLTLPLPTRLSGV